MMEGIEILAKMDYGNQLYGIARWPTISIGDYGEGDLWGQSTLAHWALPCIRPALYFNESCCVRQAMCAGVRARLEGGGGGVMESGKWFAEKRNLKNVTQTHTLFYVY